MKPIELDYVKMQAEFCNTLMTKLCGDIENVNALQYGGIPMHTQMQGDITRLRRELMKLHRMLNPMWTE